MMILIPVVALVVTVLAVGRWSAVVSEPDEWLLLVRNGRLAAGGIGVRAWRLPGDVVARFSSTVQRVAFQIDAQTREHLAVSVNGFALWSVGKGPGEALKAFSSLGLVNFEKDPAAAASRRVLAKAQHHAFQAYLCAEMQQFVSQLSLSEALSIREQQAEAVIGRLRQFMTSVGLELGQLEIIAVRPSDPGIVEALAAPEREQLKLRATQAQVVAAESIRVAQMERDARVALRSAHDRVAAAEAQLEAEQREADVRRIKQVRDAEIQRDQGLVLAELDASKSTEVRELELARMAIERAAEAFRKLPITDGKWVSIGEGGPAGQMLALAEMLRGFSSCVLRPASGVLRDGDQ
jgi:hypothetical protein